ncbi:hypothetical protein ENUP19_0171G0025 [Entamoeba nuttalli]
MSLSKESRTSSVGSCAQLKFPFELEPPIQKLTFGREYAVQGVSMKQKITFHNKTTDTYKMTVELSTSSKYTMEVDEEKLTIGKRGKKSVTISICFNTIATVGLTGSVTFQVKKKALIGNESSSLALRFQMLGVIPIVSMKEILLMKEINQLSANSIIKERASLSHITIRESTCNTETSSVDLSMLTMGLTDSIFVGDVIGKYGNYKEDNVFIFKLDTKESGLSKDDFKVILNNYIDIHHQNIIQMVGMNYDSSFLLLENDTMFNLEQILDKPLPSLFLTRCCVNLATALQYLASESVLHRNVKPYNLRLVQHSTISLGGPLVKLHDFSLARYIHEGEELHDCVGTVEYMSPEVIQHKSYGLKSDTFSLGMSILHIFSGKKPYGGMNKQQIENFVKNHQRVTPSEKVPIAIISIINKCCVEDPTKRPDYKIVINLLNDYARTLPL